MDLLQYRDLFPITAEYAYLNHAAAGTLPTPVASALHRYLDRAQTMPIELLMEEMAALQHEMKERAAQLIGAARSDEITQVPGTATGINIAAKSLPLDPGDNVLVVDGDYPSLIYPWFNLAPQGILTKVVPPRDGGLDLDLLEARIDSRTRAVAISTAMFTTGFRNDIEALGQLCKARNIYLVVDAIQTLGCLPIDVQACHIDFLACGSQKWLLSPPGSGLLYCRHDLLDRLRLGPYVGAMSVVPTSGFTEYNFTLQPTTARFETSAPNLAGIVAMHASLGLLLEVGIDRIAARVLELTGIVIADLQSRGFQIASSLEERRRSGIVVVELPDPHTAHERLLAARVITSIRGAGIRISPDFYNIQEEVCRVGEALAS